MALPSAAPGPAILPHKGTVEIRDGATLLARTDRATLHRITYAPDLYIPEADITEAGQDRAQASALPALTGLRTFPFDTVEIYVNGTRVRGHIRDPLKTITVEDVPQRLQVFARGAELVNSTAALRLIETGLPPRFYVPAEDIDEALLSPSDRQSVCTYKGEATYHHVRGRDGHIENAVWTYAAPWTDFAADIGRIAGHRGLYTSAMGEVLLDGAVQDASVDAAADAAMIASPTVDAVLKTRS